MESKRGVLMFVMVGLIKQIVGVGDQQIISVKLNRTSFPNNFIFGVASSAYQVPHYHSITITSIVGVIWSIIFLLFSMREQ